MKRANCTPSPNKSLQRAVIHKVLGRGRPSFSLTLALRARVLTDQLAAIELRCQTISQEQDDATSSHRL